MIYNQNYIEKHKYLTDQCSDQQKYELESLRTPRMKIEIF